MDKRFYRLGLMAMVISFCLSIPYFSLAQTQKPMKIGVVYPMSGAMAFISDGIATGHKLAADEIMKTGGFLGRKVEFIIRDDQGNPELNTRYCRELIINEGVEWISSGLGSAVALSATAVAAQYKTPTFIVGGATEKVTCEEWNPYTFRYRTPSIPEARSTAKIVADQMTKGINNPRIFFISWDYEYGRSFHEPFMAKIKELKPSVQIVGEAWPRTGETDFGPFISKMISTKPHVVVNAMWAGGMVSLVKQGKARGIWDISQLISVAEAGNIDYRLSLGFDMIPGMWTCAYEDPEWPNNEAQRRLYEMYHKFTGKPKSVPPPGMVGPGYYMVQLINKAMQKAKTSEPLAVCKAMEGLSIDTFLGPISVRDFDHQVTSYYVWGPLVERKGTPYLVFDRNLMILVNCEKDLYSREEWMAKRKAAGK